MTLRIHRPANGNQVAWTWINMSGPDASDFLHRLTTVNVKGLQPGSGSKGFFLSAQGRIQAYFTLWRIGASEFAFEFDAGTRQNGTDQKWKNALLSTIEHYTFAEKFTLSPADPECLWIWPEGPLGAGAQGDLKPGTTALLNEGLRLCHHGESDFGRPWITAWGTPDALSEWLRTGEEIPFEQWERWRIQAARPWVGAEITDSTNPLEVGLHEGISGNKGCYPGQEVIERTLSLGSPARRLARIDGEGAVPATADEIRTAEEPSAPAGQVTSAVSESPDRFIALAMLRKINAREGLEIRFPSGARGKVVRVTPYA